MSNFDESFSKAMEAAAPEKKSKVVVTPEMIAVYRSYYEISNKYGPHEGSYDRTRSDNIKLGQKFKKLSRLIRESGQEEFRVLPVLVSSELEVKYERTERAVAARSKATSSR